MPQILQSLSILFISILFYRHFYLFIWSYMFSLYYWNFFKCFFAKNRNFQTRISRNGNFFRLYRKRIKCSIFLEFFEYIIFSYGCKLLDWSFKGGVKRRDYSLKKNFFAKTAYIGVKSCEKSIARIPEAWKCFLDPDSGK
jgi:hypothetical protein